MSLEEKRIEKTNAHDGDQRFAGKPITDENDNKKHEREQARLMVKALRLTKDESNSFRINMGDGTEIKDSRPIKDQINRQDNGGFMPPEQGSPLPTAAEAGSMQSFLDNIKQVVQERLQQQNQTEVQNIQPIVPSNNDQLLADSSRGLTVVEGSHPSHNAHSTAHHMPHKTHHDDTNHKSQEKASHAKHEPKAEQAHSSKDHNHENKEHHQPKTESKPRADYPIDPSGPQADLSPAGPGWANVDMHQLPRVNQTLEDMPINRYNCKFYLKAFIEGHKPGNVKHPDNCEIENGYMEKQGYHKEEGYQNLKEGDVIMVKDPNRIALSKYEHVAIVQRDKNGELYIIQKPDELHPVQRCSIDNFRKHFSVDIPGSSVDVYRK